MTTQYTTILKLALPVQGELSGTWGDVVNNNITQMVEQAVAGKAVVNTWTGNSHTLTTADGTTSESRCAILELTDTGTALSGAGTVVCPTNTKLYIVDNNTAQIITVKTSGGTGIAVPVGKTMLVYCDGTNVVEGVTHANSLSLGTSTVTVSSVLDQDDMSSDSATALATQQSIKAYVDSQVGTVDTLSEILANGNTTGANDIDVENAQKVQFRDAAIYVNSSVDGQLDIVADGEVQIDTALVDINGNLDVSGTTNISGSTTFTKNAIAGVAISTIARASNNVTVTNAAVHGLTSGDLVNINGVANRSFNGYFTVSVSSTTVFTYSQTGADESSTGGTSTEIVYTLNASGTALNQMNGPLNIAANSGIDGLEITQSGSGEALSITGGNALFGDNDKAIFGIDNDLQIYHDGSNSRIQDSGSGNLKLVTDGAAIQLQSATENMVVATPDADVQLYYNGVEKLATTNTGIDITGTVVSDGLTVDGNATFTTTDNTAQVALVSTDADASDGPILEMFRNSSSPADDDDLGIIKFFGENDASEKIEYGIIEVKAVDVSDGTEDGSINITAMLNGTARSRLFSNSTETVFNEGSQDLDFRVESNGVTDALKVDAGNDQVQIGTGADLITATAGTSNFRAGVNAGNSIVSGGNYNTVVGDEAGTALTTGDNNTAVGYSALVAEDTGSRAVAVGSNALTTQNKDGNTYNVAVGYNSGTAVTTGIRNNFFGAESGEALTEGTDNIAIGYQTLTADTLGSRSVAIGNNALDAQNFTSATNAYNTAVGYAAGGAVTTGTNNTLIGGLAGDAITTASNNTAVGTS